MIERREDMIDILELCKGAETIAIGGHTRPDGDCVGSTLALFQYLKKMLPEVKVDLFLEQPAEIFSVLKGFDEINSDFLTKEKYDVFFVLDCEKSRLGDAGQFFEEAKKTVNIDHHISNKGCADVNYIVPTASSTSELVFDVLLEEYIDANIAKAIYTGIIHDSGVFQYSNTSAKTLRIAAKLIESGFDFASLIEESFYEKTYVQNQILGRALLESMLLMNGKCIVSVLDKKTMDFYGVTSKDLDGIVNQLRNTKGVDCAIFMYEINHMEYKVSMRSTENIDVAKIAAVFGGGGHLKAAGCSLNGTFHDVINNLSSQIEIQLQNR